MTATYRNPWHKPGKPEYGPAVYETHVTPTEYGGHLIYRRRPDCWDVVKDGACVTQMAGPDGARRAIDEINARAQNVATATDNADLFAEVAAHNREVIRRRQAGGSWEAPENQYRNAWLELEAVPATIDPKSIEDHFRNLTFSPDRRARMEVAALEARLQDIRDKAAALQAMPDAAPFPAGLVNSLCERHVRATRAYWAAEGRCASTMITGPANFPVERNRKRMATADKRSAEVTAHLAAAKRRLERIAFPHGMGDAIRSADPDAIAKLQAELADKREWHEHAKQANAILRKHGADSLPHLQAAGLRADVIKRAMWLDHNGKPWGLTTANSSAAIRRIEDRIRGLERMKARGTIEKEADGVRIVENAEAARLQLIFPGKPDPETIGRLKSNGFRWSPREGAWQRHLNNASRWAAERVLGQPSTAARTFTPPAVTARFRTVDEANAYLAGHPGEGVLREAEGWIEIARKDDLGSYAKAA